MLRNFFTTAVRSLLKNKTHSFINIAGLSIGMAVVILISLWIWDECNFDGYHDNRGRIAQVMQNALSNGYVNTYNTMPIPLERVLRSSCGNQFKYIVLASEDQHSLTYGDKTLALIGSYMEPSGPEMLSLKMEQGSRTGLGGSSSILLAASMAKALFGNADPMGKTVKLDSKLLVSVTGVYEDLPYNSSFKDNLFLAPWSLLVSSDSSVSHSQADWGNSSYMIYVQIADHVNMGDVSTRIKNLNVRDQAKVDPREGYFLYPMDRCHLYSEFQNGRNTGGRILYVWLFGIIGAFVLFLACINFINLSTARSKKRAKEIGVRKAIGSLRSQLIIQFFSESMVVAFLSFILSLLLTWLLLPFFNDISGKQISIFWGNPVFWGCSLGFVMLTGLMAGLYPALYLSSFRAVRALKGTFKTGRFAATPRKILIVLQFTISVMLIICTVVVFRQIQFAKNRPIGYNRNGLIVVELTTTDINDHYAAFRRDLMQSGVVREVSLAQSPTTWIWNNSSAFDWRGRDPKLESDFGIVGVSPEFGKTVGWEIIEGRDFSRTFPTDSTALILNSAAAKYMHLRHPVGETISWNGKPFKIIGVAKDMVMKSPYDPARRSVFFENESASSNFLLVRIDPGSGLNPALQKIGSVYNAFSPSSPFDFRFVDQEFAEKFSGEERIGKLASFFTILAIFISCIGLLGMASFMAEQRVKEVAVRKVLGASVFIIWRLLSREFVVLVSIALVFASLLAYYVMHNWLNNYQYRSTIPFWVFAVTAIGVILLTLLTVSYQSIKAALTDPVKNLRSE